MTKNCEKCFLFILTEGNKYEEMEQQQSSSTEEAVKLILPKKENGIYSIAEIHRGIMHMVAVKNILGLGILQSYFEWAILLEKKPSNQFVTNSEI